MNLVGSGVDQRYHGTRQGETAPLVRRLEELWPVLVLGPFQEGSDDIHALLDVLADSHLRARGLARGREGSSHERSTILAGFRRRLSMVAAKAYSTCLMDRVSRIGEGHRQAAKRRAWVKREEERMEEEQRAYWHAYVRKIGRRRGRFVG